MWKAVRAFRAGAYGAEQPLREISAAVCGRRWEHVRAQIEHDFLLGGALAPGAFLPSSKQLAARYGVCYRTIAKALAWLVADGRIARDRRRLTVPALDTVRGGTVLLIARVDPAAGATALPLRKQELFRAAELECARARVRLQVLPLGPDSSGDSAIRIPLAALGCLALTGDLSEARIRWLMALLAAGKTPVALLDETGEAVGIARRITMRRLTVFSMANSEQAGRQMGRFLLTLGHRRAAFISPTHGALWSRNRLAGLRRAFAAVPQADVVAFTRDISDVPRPQDLQDLMAQARALSLDSPRITVWVGASDSVALACRAFLAAAGWRVPGDISLAGFDDSLDAFFHQLTSYNFNCEAVMRAMVAAILGPPRPGPSHSRPVEIPGFLSVRSSTAPPATQPHTSVDMHTS